MKRLLLICLISVLFFCSCEEKHGNSSNTNKILKPQTFSTLTTAQKTTKSQINNYITTTKLQKSTTTSSTKTIKTTTISKKTSTTTIKQKSKIKKDTIPVDKFNSLKEMVSKAKSYKTVDDIYKSSGFDKNGSYYIKFTKERLTMLLGERKIFIPVFPDKTKFLGGELQALGCYRFKIKIKNKFDANLYVYTYKNAKDNAIKDYKEKFNINNKIIYSDSDNFEYLWNYNDYYICLIPYYQLDNSLIKSFINNLEFNCINV